jgi:hypothetical protein
LLAVVQHRQPFTRQYQQLKRQLGWVVELERRLDPDEGTQPPPTRRRVQQQVEELLEHLEQQAQAHPEDAAAVTHIRATFRQRWPRLFVCYAWPKRYRTNTDLETFFGRLRTRQRQIQGRKSVHEFILRYGEWVVFFDPTESFQQVLQRFQQFDQAAFDQEYARLRKAQQRLQVLYRFRHRPQCCLKQLEHQWAEAVRHKSR